MARNIVTKIQINTQHTVKGAEQQLNLHTKKATFEQKRILLISYLSDNKWMSTSHQVINSGRHPPSPTSVLDLHGDHLVVPQGQHIVVSLQLQRLAVLVGGVQAHDVLTRAAPLPGAPHHQGVVEVIVAGDLDGLGL